VANLNSYHDPIQSEQNMLMVVFGAGASYDSVSKLPDYNRLASTYRPPLASGLFSRRPHFDAWISRYYACNAVINQLQSPPNGSSVESELEKLWTEREKNPRRYRQLAAVQFYLHSMIWECTEKWEREVARGVTNYKNLLDRIDSWRRQTNEKVCLVTFNYDTMLENALVDLDIKISDLSHYIANNDYKIIKPHGSVNWAHGVYGDIVKDLRRTSLEVANELIERRSELTITSDFQMLRQPLVEQSAMWSSKSLLFPALAIPLEHKQDYECPTEHLEVLRTCIPEVTKMLLIGWRATETKFIELLKEKLQKKIIMKVVNSSESSETSKRLASALDKASISINVIPSELGFSQFVNSNQVEEFLNLK